MEALARFSHFSSSDRPESAPRVTTDMYRLLHLISLAIVGILTLPLFIGICSAQPTTAIPIAPAIIVTDASGNLLLVERRAANSIPGASPTATGLVTRVVTIPPQIGASPSTAVYVGTMSNFYLGKRAVYTILTVTQSGKTTRSLVAIDGGASGILPRTLPAVPITRVGTSDVRVVPSTGNRDAIYIIQRPSTMRRPSSPAPTPTTNAPRSIIIVEFDGTAFSMPRSVTVQ
jgi:hypothetical protein